MSRNNKQFQKTQISEAQKTSVRNAPPTRRFTIIVILLALVVFGGGLSAHLFLVNPGPASRMATAAAPQAAQASTVNHPVALFEDGRARHFDYKTTDRTIRYFILKSADCVQYLI